MRASVAKSVGLVTPLGYLGDNNGMYSRTEYTLCGEIAQAVYLYDQYRPRLVGHGKARLGDANRVCDATGASESWVGMLIQLLCPCYQRAQGLTVIHIRRT